MFGYHFTLSLPAADLTECSLLSAAGAAGRQRFRVRPSNTSVVEGQDAVLRCEVEHQVGLLQWAKDGFAMGKSTGEIHTLRNIERKVH